LANGCEKTQGGRHAPRQAAALDRGQQPQETAPQETHAAVQTAKPGHLQTQ